MSGNYSGLPFGFSSFIDLLSHYYGGLIGMDRADNLVKAELKNLFAQEMAQYAKAEMEADKVALELAIEEEMEKLKRVQLKEKTDRKSERKKRQRLRRKLKKVDDSDEMKNFIKKDTDDDKEEEEGDSLDVNSAFVSNAAIKISNTKLPVPKSNSSQNDGNSIKEKKKNVISACGSKDHPVTILAIEGFNFAKEGLLDDAINKFSEALFLTPEDYRLYANRCLCYLQIHEYQKALEDSKYCVKYAPDYAIGHFRMGEAYLGLNNFQSAEQAFEQVIKLDPNCEEALNDLVFIQMKKLMDMGFSKEKAAAAMQKMKTLNAAIEYLLHSSNDSCNGNDIQNTSGTHEESRGSEIFQSDEEGDESFFNKSSEKECDESDKFSEAASAVSTLVSDTALVQKDYRDFRKNPSMDYNNPYHCKRLYIGNVSAKISKKFLETTFARFGPIVSIKMLPSSKCAFITYDNWKSAGKAMEKLQNWSLVDGTPSVVIQYPNTDLQKLAGNSLSVISEKIKFKSDNTRSSSAFDVRDDWCSQTMPPSSPAPSISSVRSSYSQAVLHSPQKKKKNDLLKESSNPNRCASLYIGNIVQKVKERDLLNLFSKYGQVISVRVIPEKKCAFVNFTNDNNAALAMHSLQGRSIFPGFPPMVIKYPTKAVKTINPRASPNKDGQILGDECYNWRTLGCSLGNTCPNIHVPEHKGIALRHKAVQSFNF